MEREGHAATLARAAWPHFEADDSPEKTPFRRAEKPCATSHRRVRGVMLHLRARYVSKAAILTIPARQVPVENRSPA
jgi:hypothetical protein